MIMTEKEFLALLRDLSGGPSDYLQGIGNAAADRIERLEIAVRNRIHWIDGEDHCDCGECEALISALKGH